MENDYLYLLNYLERNKTKNYNLRQKKFNNLSFKSTKGSDYIIEKREENITNLLEDKY